MICEYYEGWHRHYREPIEQMSPEEAHRRFREGQPCCAVIRKDDQSFFAFININNNYYSVNFLDDELRVFLAYGFEDNGLEKLFLNQASYLQLQPGESKPRNITSYYFEPSGKVVIERRQASSSQGTLEEKSCDVSGNWEPKSPFGQFDGLLRIERKIG